MSYLEYNNKTKILSLNNNGKVITVKTPSVWKGITKINDIYKSSGIFLIDVIYDKGIDEEAVDFLTYLSELQVPVSQRPSYFKGLNKDNIEIRNTQ